MLESLFTRASAASRLRSTLLGPWLDSFADGLSALGYPSESCLSYVRLAADLGRWMTGQKVPVEALDELVIGTYVARRKKQDDRRRVAALHFLEHLRAAGVVAARPVVPDTSPWTPFCGRHEEYLRKERGAAEGTIEGYVAVTREFLRERFGTGEVDLAAISASDIGGYLVRRSRSLSPKRVAYLATALRSFFRCLFVRGEIASDLSTAALTAQLRHLATVPRYLAPEDVEKLLETCDPGTRSGKRNRAMLLLMVRLGLRAGEVAALDLDDVRWRSGELVVRGKGNVVDRLPLLPEVGKALALYAAEARPRIPSRRLFLRLCAPIKGLAGRGGVSTVVRDGLERAGLRPAVRGAHLLRHSLGTRMIRAGASMAEIGEVLRHHSPGTTEVYAKVDFEALRAIAQPWLGAGGAQ